MLNIIHMCMAIFVFCKVALRAFSICEVVCVLITYLYLYVCAKSLQSRAALCDPMDCGLPGSSVHGILQARILRWVIMPSSRGSSQRSVQPLHLLQLLH